MSALLAAASILLILLTLVDAFETTILPRQVMHRFRFVRLYYRTTWKVWRGIADGMLQGKSREAMLSWFGPLSLLGLFASWVLALIFGFALLHWSLGTAVHSVDNGGQAGPISLSSYLYLSGTTFFTLGYGDITPSSAAGRCLAVIESGIGFGFLAMVISYMPVLYQAFSRREVTISLMDARAGSPPSAGEVLIRMARAGNVAAADQLLAEWERWSAELLESHLSYPALGFYRSQHDNQSWLAAVTIMLDTCTFLLAGMKTNDPYRAQLTFAMARHAVVDLSLVLKLNAVDRQCHRVTTEQLNRLREQLQAAGIEMNDVAVAEPRLAALRAVYEPFVSALSRHFHFDLPAIVLDQPAVDNWQRSASMPRAPGISDLAASEVGEQHF
jgi:Ion channel